MSPLAGRAGDRVELGPFADAQVDPVLSVHQDVAVVALSCQKVAVRIGEANVAHDKPRTLSVS